MDECTFAVTVKITPLWIRPSDSLAQDVGRRAAEAGFAMLADEASAMIYKGLEQWQRGQCKQ